MLWLSDSPTYRCGPNEPGVPHTAIGRLMSNNVKVEGARALINALKTNTPLKSFRFAPITVEERAVGVGGECVWGWVGEGCVCECVLTAQFSGRRDGTRPARCQGDGRGAQSQHDAGEPPVSESLLTEVCM